jgi:hypothetical protein
MMQVSDIGVKGQREMRKNQSKAEKVFWPMQAGRPREVKPGLIAAVNLGQIAATRLYDAMKEAGLRVRDSGCVLVCATKEGKVAKAGLFDPAQLDASGLEMLKTIHNSKWTPIGIALWVLDREKGYLLSHVRPFERTETNMRLLESVLDEWSMDNKRGSALRFD